MLMDPYGEAKLNLGWPSLKCHVHAELPRFYEPRQALRTPATHVSLLNVVE